ncbi:hypothetical protein SAMN02745248_01796 [Hathewaya proteolytica DSM 3090]|uniref:Uncharacterized protein n=1 Tax=Hathewaya proteolytica DSM 3090 TaxID=1121331 RepID=A0A1M6PTE1_9CLOT|nr:hypothetical protein [Hathewaya proteolytica]SHK11223.1 hypothetical protein SAMN02745248_01796 [Hathewaya proteolytica DSM 3090]
MSKSDLYVIPKEDINNFLDYADNISIFTPPKIKPGNKVNKTGAKSIKLIEELKEQKSIINKLIETKEELSEKYLKLSSLYSSLEQRLSLSEKQSVESLMETLAALENNNDFLDTLLNTLLPENNMTP